MTSIADFLRENGTLTYPNVGTSMMPLLRQGKDLLVVRARKEGERFRVGDVVLYHRPPDRYVLHRIVEVRPEDYVILGDNCVRREYGIKDGDILGLMTGYVRGGREHSTEERGYRIYSAWVLRTEKFRIACKRLISGLRRTVKRVIGK